MRKLIPAFFSITIIFLISCGNGPENKAESTEETASTTVAYEVKPAFTPFNAVTIHRRIPDFNNWIADFNTNDSLRKAIGLSVLNIGRHLDDTSMVFIGIRANNINNGGESILRWMHGLKEKSGETDLPKASFLTVIRYDSSKAHFKQRAIVTYHVKDFDRWLSFYDEKGTATREPYGLLDLGLARDVNDSNIVHIQFAISDVEKAKARLSSPELKKLLSDAGVNSEINVSFYKVVQ